MAGDSLEVKRGSLEVKRLYLDAKHKTKCPSCGKDHLHDFSEDYLSYPYIGEYEDVTTVCLHCGHEWEFKVKLTINLEIKEVK